jgi:aldehyde:ferredoxin oxidoreductase
VADLVRRFNLREGMLPEDEQLPQALFRKLQDSGKLITAEDMHAMMDEYYQLHGWSPPAG